MRVLRSAGLDVEQRDEPAAWDAPAPVDDAPLLLAAEAEAAEAVARVLQAAGRGAAVLLGQGDEADAARLLCPPGMEDAVWGVLGHRGLVGGQLDCDAALLALGRHVLGQPLPPLQGYLLWAAPAWSAELGSTAGREAAVARIVSLCADQLLTSRKVAEGAGEVVHELITNALYDAPVDTAGQAQHDRDRTAQVELPPGDRLSFRYGSDGTRLALEVVDRFGRLTRAALCGSLRRAAQGVVNHQAGGAGIGLGLVHRAAQTLQVEALPGQRTRITAVLELEPPRSTTAGGTGPHEAVRPGRTLIFPSGGAPQGLRPPHPAKPGEPPPGQAP